MSRGFFCVSEQKYALSISSSTVSTAQCSGGNAVSLTTLSIPYTTTESSSIATISTFSAYAPLLQIMYQSSDVSTTTTSSSSSTTSTSSGQGTNLSGSQGLSTGASAGIGVGVGLGLVILASAAFWYWRARQKNTKTTASDDRSNAENFPNSRAGGVGTKSPSELQGYKTVPEIDSSTRFQEVDGVGVEGPHVDGARGQQVPPVELA